MTEGLVLGLDIGGTSTRAVVTDLTGAPLGRGRGGGGNPVAHGPEAAGAQLRTAVTAALAGVAPDRVRAATVGLAGAGSAAGDPRVRTAFDAVWAAAGLDCGYRLVPDPLVAYAAGTDRPDGTVLIAGTGAIAAQVRDGRLERLADGHGWLLGDAGSGFWLGREAVRTALAELDGEAELSDLARLVLTELGVDPAPAARRRDSVGAVVRAVHAGPPVGLAGLAPTVTAAAAAGSATAAGLLERAAGHLVSTVSVVRAPAETGPVVLAGGLLTGGTPLATAVRRRLAAGWPAAALPAAGDGAAAAAWLAAREIAGDRLAPTFRTAAGLAVATDPGAP